MTLRPAVDRHRENAAESLRQALDLIRPRALTVSLLRGTGILLRLLLKAMRAGFRKATSPPAPKRPPAKASVTKSDTPPGDAQEAGEEPAAEPSGRRARAGGDRLQNAALTLLVLLVAAGALKSVGSALLYLLRPYATIVVTVLTLVWFAAALTADAVTRPEVDHDEAAGEDPTEDDQEDADDEPEGAEEGDVEKEPQAAPPWPVQRDLLRKFVEHRVTAGASGFREGVKGRGARVDDLLAEQQQHGGLIGLDRKGMIALLEKAGITVREQMKFSVHEDTPAGLKWKPKNVPGVHIEDLAKDLGRNPNLPGHLVPDLTPGAPPLLAEKTPENVIPIPLARASGE